MRFRISLETRDLARAQMKALQIRARPDLVPGDGWQTEVYAYLAERVAEDRLTKMYAGKRKSALMLFAGAFGIRSPSQVTTQALQRWHDGYAEKNAATAKHYVLHVRSFLKWLVEKNRLRTNAAEGVRFHARVPRFRDVFVERETVAKLLDAAPDDELRLILLLGFECGMRRGEICEARVDWLNLAAGKLTIPAKGETFQRKNRRPSTVPLTARARAFFAEREWPGPFLLRPEKKHGKHAYRVEFEDRYREFMDAHGCKRVTIHDMRRSFCSNRISAGMSVEEVAFIVGDTPQVVWKNYARFIPASNRAELGAA